MSEVKLKRQMNDIIDVAYQNKKPSVKAQLKRFTILCSDTDLRTKLGDCRYLPDGSSRIRIFAMGTEGFHEVLITTMHEVSHHIDHSLRGRSGHDSPFYLAHKKLLFAAMDMGIISKDDVVYSDSKAQNRDKLAKMMDEYAPHPVEYKPDNVMICVYNAFSVKSTLKERGYQWNSLDEAWTRELTSGDLDAEQQLLSSLGLEETDIKIVEGNAVVVRLRKNARLYNVPFESNQTVKGLGFHWVNNGKQKYWEKKLYGESLTEEESEVLNAIPGIKIKIT